MWVKYKTRKDTSVEEVMKLFKNKYLDVILTNPKNKQIAKIYKSKNPKLPKGTEIWVLDPKATVYIGTLSNGKKAVFTEKEWKAGKDKAIKAMESTLKAHKSTHETMVWVHDLMRKTYDEHPVISFFTKTWVGNKGVEPIKHKKESKRAVDKLEKVVKARDFAKFEAAAKEANKKVRAYSIAVDEWKAQHSGSSENWEIGLTVVRDGGFILFSVLGGVVAAPATVAGAAGVGALASGGGSFLSSAATEVGRHMTDEKGITVKTSAKKILKETAIGSVFGLACGGLAKALSGALAGKFAEKIATKQMAGMLSKTATKADWLVKLEKEIYAKELNAMMQSLSKDILDDAAGALVKITPEIQKQVASRCSVKLGAEVAKFETKRLFAEQMADFVIGLGSDTVGKFVQEYLNGSEGAAWFQAIIKDSAPKIKGKMDEKKLAEVYAMKLATTRNAQSVFDVLLKGNARKLEADYSKEVRSALEAEAKKIRKEMAKELQKKK